MAGAPGGRAPGPAAGEPLPQRRDSGQGFPEQQSFLSSLFPRNRSCPLMLLKTLETNPYVKLLLDAMKHSGCAINKERHFSCEDCDGNVSGGFDSSTSQTCVRDRAVLSILAVRNISTELAQQAVDEVFESCFNDHEPFGRIPHDKTYARYARRDFQNRDRYYSNI
ncbi:mitochondrial inner membrane protease ATP23 homolog isoform X2 [Nannospalax galili]|uniref:mitochondrial inner membrane protease ATP23 homolog isoform X2 n=1 Tax=Nannospalax galili TaxID=1026970 RepID=UPI0004ED1DCE|nr:mitochondrial inner membrane protease ATP23 homolog isoform X2 [Nannospalax galili]